MVLLALFVSTRKRLFSHLTSSRLFTSVKAHFLLVANEDYFCFEVDLHTHTNTHAGILRRSDNILTSISPTNSAFFIKIDSEPSKPRFYIIPSKKKTIPPRLDRRSKDSCCSLDAWWIRHDICQKKPCWPLMLRAPAESTAWSFSFDKKCACLRMKLLLPSLIADRF